MLFTLFTGLSSEEKLHGVKYIIESFVGCIRNVVLSSGKAASDLLPITPLIATKHENVKEGCFNKCHTVQNLCFVDSLCINHYFDISCNCFGTHYEGEQCDIYSKFMILLKWYNDVCELLLIVIPIRLYPQPTLRELMANLLELCSRYFGAWTYRTGCVHIRTTVYMRLIRIVRQPLPHYELSAE